jgi:hypothetical protein
MDSESMARDILMECDVSVPVLQNGQDEDVEHQSRWPFKLPYFACAPPIHLFRHIHCTSLSYLVPLEFTLSKPTNF